MKVLRSIAPLVACASIVLTCLQASADGGTWYDHSGKPIGGEEPPAAAPAPAPAKVEAPPAGPKFSTPIRVGSAGHAPTRPSTKRDAKPTEEIAQSGPGAPAPVVQPLPKIGVAPEGEPIEVFQPKTKTTTRRHSSYPVGYDGYATYGHTGYGYSYPSYGGYRSYPSYPSYGYGRCYTPTPCTTPVYRTGYCGPSIQYSGRIGNASVVIRTGR